MRTSRWGDEGQKYALTSDEEDSDFWGFAHGAEGFFTPAPEGERVWDLIRTGRLNRVGLWHGLAPADRRAWLSVALMSGGYRRQGQSDAPAGRVFTLDGRHIVDEDSFSCALGEAVDGPGGYFGWNLDALDDCLCGGWGATVPFTLHWDSSAVSRERLAEVVETADRDVPLFDLLLEVLASRGARVVLR
ncbi:barstar family protein [Streptomyces hydrogenans]|uniref:barstar family protein n=1 Tax=Streptomyces hydrogenans TaxID=1873719 RepID=UPI0037F7D23F